MAVTINGSAGVTTNSGAVYDSLQRGTAVTCAGQTSIDFTGIPSWVRRITVMFSNVSTSGTSPIQVQLGDSGGFEITGYLGGAQLFINTGSIVYTNSNTAGLSIETAQANLTASTVRHGQIVLSLIGSNLWTMTSNMAHTGTTTAALGAGSKTLSDTLTQVRITTVNGTDTFDTTPSAGTINIIYE